MPNPRDVRLRTLSQLSQLRLVAVLLAGLAFAAVVVLSGWMELVPEAPPGTLVMAVMAVILGTGSSLLRARASLGVHRWALSTGVAATLCTLAGWIAAHRAGASADVTLVAELAGGVLLYLAAIMVGGCRPYDGTKRMEGIVIAAGISLALLLLFDADGRIGELDVVGIVVQGNTLMVLSAALAMVAIEGWRPSPGVWLLVVGALANLVGVHLGIGEAPGAAAIAVTALGHLLLLAGIAIGDPGLPAREHRVASGVALGGSIVLATAVLIADASSGDGGIVLNFLALVVLVGLLGRTSAASGGPIYTDPSAIGGIDRLTGLPDRHELEAVLARELEYAGQRNSTVALSVLSLTNLHEINETLGHHVGDEVLREFAGRLSAASGTDVPVRLAGNSFALVLRSQVTERGVRESLERLVSRLEAPLQVDGVALTTQVRVGLVFFPSHGRTVAELLQRAEIAAQEAKEKNTSLLIYDPARDLRTRERLVFATQLREGIERDELRVYFQPKIDLATGTCVGAEALVRWQHPEEGLLTPDRFLPVAERTGQMGQLTNWVLAAALSEARRWRLAGYDLHVAVNLSLPNLDDRTMPVRLAQLLERYGLSGSALELEITEDMAMADPAHTAEVTGRIRQLGVGCSLDDFGTGYSSLAHLKHLRCNELKIDRSFVRDLVESEDDRVIAWSILDLARNLGMRTVAEGIETAEVAELLATMGCGMGQGYHFARPLSAEAFMEWCADRQGEGLLRLQPVLRGDTQATA